MALVTIKLVLATDLDGTLYYPKKRIRMITRKSERFLRRVLSDGGKIVLVSGRNVGSALHLCARTDLPLDYICCNGAVVSCNGVKIFEKTFDSGQLKPLLNEIMTMFEIPMTMLFTRDSENVVSKKRTPRPYRLAFDLYRAQLASYREKTFSDDELFEKELAGDGVYKMMLFFGIMKKKVLLACEAQKILAKRYPEFTFAWSAQSVEITPKGCTKSEAITFYLEYNRLNSDNVVVVGDSGNDISMFEAFPKRSFCMAHADQSVQIHASHIIRRFHHIEDYIYPSVEKKSHGTDNEKEGINQ